MDTGLVLGLLGLIIGAMGLLFSIAALICVFYHRDARRQAVVHSIERRMEGFTDKAEGLLDSFDDRSRSLLADSAGVLEEVHRIREAASNVRVDLPIFLATQWGFIEKVAHHRFEKNAIARKITTKYIRDGMAILLDSGSTTDLVTFELLGRQLRDVTVYSNNVYAAIHLAGTSEVTFQLLGGQFNERYAAVYSREAINRLDQFDLDLFVFAAAALRFDDGIMVHRKDTENYEFKQTALRLAAKRKKPILVAADPSKLCEPTEDHMGVVPPEEWQSILRDNADRIVIVTSLFPPDLDEQQRAAVVAELSKFKTAGVNVDDAPD